jgi:lon-related putative ATP-dependent protease
MTGKSKQSLKVPADRLRAACELLGVEFERTEELPARTATLGHERAIDAIDFGMKIDSDGHNVFVLGRHGTHRHGLAQELAEAQAATEPVPGDWCYVNNFSNPERPRTLNFPAGTGNAFRKDMGALIEELRLAIPAAFEGDDYRAQLKSVEAATQKELEEQWQDLEDRAKRKGIGVLQTPTGYVLAPVRDGQVLGDEDFEKLPGKERKEIQATIQELSEELQSHIERMPQLRKQFRERVKSLNREVTENAVGALISDLKHKYAALLRVGEYLDDVQANIIENADDFHEHEESPLPFMNRDSSRLFSRFEVNLLVSNDEDSVAPVLFEPNPTYNNIIGKVEDRSEMGALVTDFRLIRAGALLEANGGYLILDAHGLLTRPFVWEALKQALFAKQVRIESPGETWGLVSTTTLKPEPIPLDVKIILIGERWLYYLLSTYDSEFGDLFKIAADLDDELKRSDENIAAFVHLVADRARDKNLLPLSRRAVQRVIEQRMRWAEDSERLSLHMRSLEDLLVQADFWAKKRDAGVVEAEDVAKAVEETVRRIGRTQSKIVDAIERDVLLVDTDGACVGQVNGLSIIAIGEFIFGHPVRITATTRLGSGKVVDIEREVELGGAIHSKGVMILSSLLSSRFAREVPLAMHANIVFEQSYGGVEGDSASVSEYCALLSSVSGVPIRQNIAVTGSVNQLGRVQVVGGINEKIEGFFEICKSRGLDGSHGVVIPADNVKHLMLHEEVVDAVNDGKFTVYAVRDVNEAVTLLTGIEAGERDDEGNFPADTVNARVEEQMIRYATLRRDFDAEEKDGKEPEETKAKKSGESKDNEQE